MLVTSINKHRDPISKSPYLKDKKANWAKKIVDTFKDMIITKKESLKKVMERNGWMHINDPYFLYPSDGSRLHSLKAMYHPLFLGDTGPVESASIGWSRVMGASGSTLDGTRRGETTRSAAPIRGYSSERDEEELSESSDSEGGTAAAGSTRSAIIGSMGPAFLPGAMASPTKIGAGTMLSKAEEPSAGVQSFSMEEFVSGKKPALEKKIVGGAGAIDSEEEDDEISGMFSGEASVASIVAEVSNIARGYEFLAKGDLEAAHLQFEKEITEPKATDPKIWYDLAKLYRTNIGLPQNKDMEEKFLTLISDLIAPGVAMGAAPMDGSGSKREHPMVSVIMGCPISDILNYKSFLYETSPNYAEAVYDLVICKARKLTAVYERVAPHADWKGMYWAYYPMNGESRVIYALFSLAAKLGHPEAKKAFMMNPDGSFDAWSTLRLWMKR